MTPPAYPRVPHLFPNPGGTRDDAVLSAEQSTLFLLEPVVVEEKLDGANVALWSDHHGNPTVALRSGSGSMDRGGQLGRLRAWTSERRASLVSLLNDDWVLYGEWLWRQHSVPYDRLPDLLIGLDLWHSELGFVRVAERNDRLRCVDLAPPPLVFEGVVGRRGKLEDLVNEPSSFWSGAAEGLILRREDGSSGPRIAKLVAPSFKRVDDEAWRRRVRHNRLNAGLSTIGGRNGEEGLG